LLSISSDYIFTYPETITVGGSPVTFPNTYGYKFSPSSTTQGFCEYAFGALQSNTSWGGYYVTTAMDTVFLSIFNGEQSFAGVGGAINYNVTHWVGGTLTSGPGCIGTHISSGGTTICGAQFSINKLFYAAGTSETGTSVYPNYLWLFDPTSQPWQLVGEAIDTSTNSQMGGSVVGRDGSDGSPGTAREFGPIMVKYAYNANTPLVPATIQDPAPTVRGETAGTYDNAAFPTLNDLDLTATLADCQDGANTCPPSGSLSNPYIATVTSTGYLRASASNTGWVGSPTSSTAYTITSNTGVRQIWSCQTTALTSATTWTCALPGPVVSGNQVGVLACVVKSSPPAVSGVVENLQSNSGTSRQTLSYNGSNCSLFTFTAASASGAESFTATFASAPGSATMVVWEVVSSGGYDVSSTFHGQFATSGSNSIVSNAMTTTAADTVVALTSSASPSNANAITAGTTLTWLQNTAGMGFSAVPYVLSEFIKQGASGSITATFGQGTSGLGTNTVEIGYKP
jgi:hypothetical protein